MLIEQLPRNVRRVLDLGTGDGRLLGLVKLAHPECAGVALDFSPPMLEKARVRFAGDGTVRVVEHDLAEPLPNLMGPFDAVVSCFAIHHLEHERKRELYDEVFGLLEPGGVFLNLEHVSSPTPRLHERFFAALGLTVGEEDPSDRLLDVETQLRWLREIGFADVDCQWKWLEMALLGGEKHEGSLGRTPEAVLVWGAKGKEVRGMAKSYEEMLDEAREETEQTDPDSVRDALKSGEDITILDVREPEEWEEWHIKGAKHLPRGLLELKAAEELPDTDARIVTHCASGGRGTLASRTLGEMGYTNVANMEGGVKAWQERGYEIE